MGAVFEKSKNVQKKVDDEEKLYTVNLVTNDGFVILNPSNEEHFLVNIYNILDVNLGNNVNFISSSELVMIYTNTI